MNTVEAIIDDVVNQFADPLAFFRELVQNAIDAGSGEIAVRVDYEHESAVIRVDDFGEGMTREIIENKLTKLFASSKDNDFTKIGRFGIGFASVFAIQPSVVVVDTARAGEQWRVLFHPDRTWELMRLDEPREGTCITVVKPMSSLEFNAFKPRVEKVLKHWCRFSRIPVSFQGEDIGAPFEVEALVTVSVDDEETRIVAGFSPELESLAGYYNRGLTLMEQQSSRWPHMTFRIDSRYLEHTLTRDRVRETDHWARVVAMLDDVHKNLLPNAFLEQLKNESAVGPTQRWKDLAAFFPVLRKYHPETYKRIDDLPLFKDTNGVVHSPKTIKKWLREDKVFVRTDSHVCDGLDATLLMADNAAMTQIAESLGFRVRRPQDALVAPLYQQPEGFSPLHTALTALHPETRISWAGLSYPESAVGQEPAIWHSAPLRHIPVWQWNRVREASFTKSAALIVNVDHDAIVNAAKLAKVEPELAAYMVTKLLTARSGIAIEEDDVWLRSSTQNRLARGGGQ
ncbi:MAG: ATP-binding protein [bacterium]